MIDYEAEKRIKIPKEIKTGAAILMAFTDQIFAFIGGSVVFQHIFHVPIYIGAGIMALIYGVMIFLYYDKI